MFFSTLATGAANMDMEGGAAAPPPPPPPLDAGVDAPPPPPALSDLQVSGAVAVRMVEHLKPVDTFIGGHYGGCTI